jgi:hypothetical protein
MTIIYLVTFLLLYANNRITEAASHLMFIAMIPLLMTELFISLMYPPYAVFMLVCVVCMIILSIVLDVKEQGFFT